MNAAPVLTPADRRAFGWLLLIALVVLGAGIGLRDPWPSDEPRFTLVAKQMVESGDWMFPHRGSELYSDKPPMLMWLEAISFEITRNWRIAFLLPSLLAGLLTLTLTWDLGRRLWNPRAGLYAAGAVLCVFQFVYQTKRAQIDPLVMGWITLANWGLLLHFLRGPDWRKYWLGCFAAGLGVITKGVGVLALLMFLPYVWARVRGWDGVTRTQGAALRWLLGVVMFLLPIALWLVPMLLAAQARGTPEYAAYVHDLLFRQTAQRYADSWAHAQPFYYFAIIVVANWFPLSLAYIGGVPRWWRDLRAGEPRVMLPLVWSLLVILFFSIPRGKRDVYLMPVTPMVALALAPYLADMVRTRWLQWTTWAIALGGGVVLFGLGVAALQGHVAFIQKGLAQRELLDEAHGLLLMTVGIGATFAVLALALRPRGGVAALLGGLGVMWLAYSVVVHIAFNDSSSSRGAMEKVAATIGPDAELGFVAWKEQNLLMADRPVKDFGFKRPWDQQFVDAAQWQAQAPDQRWIFSLETAMGDCVEKSKAVHVAHANRREWWVFKADAVKPGCRPDTSVDKDQDADAADP